MLRLKSLREERNLSQLDVAKGIETSQRNIGRWESGSNEPSSSFVIKLANFFNCSADYLLGREDDFGVINSKPGAVSFTREQSELLAVFDLLPVEQQREVIGFAKALAY